MVETMVAKKRVLIVDDEPTVLEFMRRVLSRNAYECRTARDSGQALDEMNKQPADVVVTDIHMPGSDGAWLLNAIKQHWPEVPVIMLSGDDEAETAMACVKSGAADYLVKPIEIPRFLAAVRTALGLGEADRIDSPTAKT
jgi:two-component system nitrogen regulation response regulator NtrX